MRDFPVRLGRGPQILNSRNARDRARSLVAAILIGTLVAACGGSTASSNSSSTIPTQPAPTAATQPSASGNLTGTIRVAAWGDWKFMEALGVEYAKTHPGVTVTLEAVPGLEWFQQLPQILSTTSAPDVFTLNGAPQLIDPVRAKPELVVDLSDVWASDGIAAAVDASTAAKYTEKNGGHLAVPFMQGWIGNVVYNKDLFTTLGIAAPAGPVATAEEWDRITTALTAAGKTPLALAMGDFIMAQVLYFTFAQTSCGNDWYAEIIDGWRPGATPKAKFSDPCSVRAFEKVKEWGDQGVFGTAAASRTRAQAETLFNTGAAGMILTGQWQAEVLKTANAAFKPGWFLIPPVDPSIPTLFQVSDQDTLAVASRSSNIPLAVDFVRFAVSKDTEELLFGLGRIPVRQDVAVPATFDPFLGDQFASIPKHGLVQNGASNVAAGINDRLQTGLQELLVGQITAQALSEDVEGIASKLRSGQ